MPLKIQLVILALKYIGVRAFPGSNHNPVVMSMFTKSGNIEVVNDETPWCSAFLKAVTSDLNIKLNVTLAARSWLNVGSKIERPSLGDIVILWRESPTSWKGHVGIYISESEENVFLLGGNQANEVNVARFPKNQVLGYRDVTNLVQN